MGDKTNATGEDEVGDGGSGCPNGHPYCQGTDADIDRPELCFDCWGGYARYTEDKTLIADGGARSSGADGLIVADPSAGGGTGLRVTCPLQDRLVGVSYPASASPEMLAVVTNPKHGSTDRPTAYHIQEVTVGDMDLQTTTVYTCTCKAFKYHEMPELGAFDVSPAGSDELRAALKSVGECKHIIAWRKAWRESAADDPDQQSLVEE